MANYNQLGANNPNWNGGWKNRLPKCLDCNKQISRNSIRCKSCARKGINHPNYRNGATLTKYTKEFRDLRPIIRQRDNYTCQNCQMTEEEHLIVYGSVLTVHHIDYDKTNNKEDNLITSCNPCNTRFNFNRQYWIDFFRNKLCCKQ